MIKKQTANGAIKVTFTLSETEPAGPVSVVGTFNDWTPGEHRLVRRRGGIRSVAVTVPPGTELRFRYLAEGGHWFDDGDADAIDGHGSLILV